MSFEEFQEGNGGQVLKVEDSPLTMVALPSKNPFHHAFTFTFVGVLFLVAGLLGCLIRKDPWSIQACRWSDSPWWSEVGFGAAMLLVSVYFWKRALRTLR